MKDIPFKHLAHLPSFTIAPIIFFTATTFHRRPILNVPAALQILTDIWSQSAERNGWFVGRYILMPDHVHFFARHTLQAETTARWVKLWKSLSARQISRVLKIEPPIWQEEYFDRFLRSSDNYAAKWTYVANNPVRANLVEHTEDWPYQGELHRLEI